MKIRLSAGIVNGAGIIFAALGWLLSFKIIAYWQGPEGVGLFAQLRQIVQTATLVITFGGTNVLVQVLTFQDDEASKTCYRDAAFKIFGLTGLVLTLIFITLAPTFTLLLFASNSPAFVDAFRLLAFAVLLSSVATIYLAILNSYQSLVYMSITQSCGPLLLAMFLWLNVYETYAEINFFSIALIFCFGLGCIVGGLGVQRLRLATIHSKSCALSLQQFFEFIRFAISNLLAVISSSIVLLIIRAWIIEAKGLEFAGLFDAGWALTFNYTTLLLTACNASYLPMLTISKDIERQKDCMLKVAYGVLGATTLVCYSLIVGWHEIVHLLYSPKFEAAGEALVVLVIAVMVRGVSWVYGTLLVATRRAKVLLVSDLTMNLVLLVCVRYALDTHASLESLGWAFLVPHWLYLIFIVEYVRKTNPLMRRRHIWPLLLVAVAPLLYLAVSPDGLRWSSTACARAIIGAFCLVLCGFIYRVFRKVVV